MSFCKPGVYCCSPGLSGFPTNSSVRVTGTTGELVTADGWISSFGITQEILEYDPVIFTYKGPFHNVGVNIYSSVTGFLIDDKGKSIMKRVTGYDALNILVTGTYNINYSFFASNTFNINRTAGNKYQFHLTYNNVFIPNSNCNTNTKNIDFKANSTGLLRIIVTRKVNVSDDNYFNFYSVTMGSLGNNDLVNILSFNDNLPTTFLAIAYNSTGVSFNGNVGGVGLSFTNKWNTNFYVSSATINNYTGGLPTTATITGTWITGNSENSLSTIMFQNPESYDTPSFENFKSGVLLSTSTTGSFNISYNSLYIRSTVYVILTFKAGNIINSVDPNFSLRAGSSNRNYNTMIYSNHNYFANKITIISQTDDPIQYLIFEVANYYTPNYSADLTVVRVNK